MGETARCFCGARIAEGDALDAGWIDAGRWYCSQDCYHEGASEGAEAAHNEWQHYGGWDDGE